MKKLTVLAAGLLLLVPTLAFSDTFSLRLGYFMPGASTNILTHPDSLWAIEFDQMSFTKNKFQGTMIGFGYEYFVSKNISLAFTLDSFSKTRPGYYVDYVQFEFEGGDSFAFPSEYNGDFVEHAFGVSSTPLQFSVKLLPLGRKARLIPFLGGGGGIYFWRVKMYGQWIDFQPLDEFGDPEDWFYDFETESAYSNPTDPALRDLAIFPVNSTNTRERGTVFGYHAFAGFQIPIGFRATLEAEARYHWAKAKFNEWFVGFEDFDLGGLAITLGFSYWF